MCDCAPLRHEFVAQPRNLWPRWCISRPISAKSPLFLKISSARSSNTHPLAGIQLRISRGGNSGKIRLAHGDSSGSPSGREPNKQKTLGEATSLESGSRDDSEDEESEPTDASVLSSFDFLELKRELEREGSEASSSDEEDSVQKEGLGGMRSGPGKLGGLVKRRTGGRQVLRRSSLIAKQVIAVDSARSLGFVSQLWVDTRSWAVLLVEVRPTLLSGEIEKFLLEDVCRVGDVVLLQDESVIENELKMVGLDTLVGYNVATSRRRNVGKVRGYTFNINSGAVESLELDSFGISFVPSNLVSTYCLFVEDVLGVVSDTVIVHEDAVSRVQRLTKGFWDAQSVNISREDHSDFERRWPQSDHNRGRSQKDFSSRNFPRKMRDIEDDWELPMDYK